MKKGNCISEYGEQTRGVFDRYTKQSIENIEILTVPLICDFGSKTEIIKVFGSPEAASKALNN